MTTHSELTKSGRRLPEQTRERPAVTPLVDIYENSEEILLVADVPGVLRDNISVNLDKDQLTLWARRNGQGTSPSRGEEHPWPDYYRAFLVPQSVDASRISADLSDGVVRVHLPKSEAVKPRRIDVKAG